MPIVSIFQEKKNACAPKRILIKNELRTHVIWKIALFQQQEITAKSLKFVGQTLFWPSCQVANDERQLPISTDQPNHIYDSTFQTELSNLIDFIFVEPTIYKHTHVYMCVYIYIHTYN